MTVGEIWAVIWAKTRNAEPDWKESAYQRLMEDNTE